jgi:RNA polymerase-binding transcription factor DksA
MSRGFRNADETQAMSEQATATAINEILERDREQAEQAARQRAAGKAGVCEDCGGPIAPERMEALPDSTRCVGCQAAWDKAQR